MQKSFEFDVNKCTGCHACAIACSIENEVSPGFSWRNVNTFNQFRYPGIPYFHLSLACNHCIDAPCLKYCPALAIKKDSDTGIVSIDEKKCIGCKYCTWVCPYDSPRYNNKKRISEKCTFCDHRLPEQLEPACVSICPTDALKTSIISDNDVQKPVSGFKYFEIKPAIKIEPLRKGNLAPEMDNMPYDQSVIDQFFSVNSISTKKITAWSEWTLLLFTLFSAILTGLFALEIQNVINLNPLFFIPAGFITIILSLLHLGKKVEFYRAILNFKNSWLSREVLLE